VLVVLLAVSDCGMVLALLLLGVLLLVSGLVALGLAGVAGCSACGVVLWLGVLGVAEGCWSGVLGVVWVCGVLCWDGLELGVD
jgi:hypothetical protein